MTEVKTVQTIHGGFIAKEHIIDVQNIPRETYIDSDGKTPLGTYCKRLVTMASGREHFVHVGMLLKHAPEFLDMRAGDVIRVLDHMKTN